MTEDFTPVVEWAVLMEENRVLRRVALAAHAYREAMRHDPRLEEVARTSIVLRDALRDLENLDRRSHEGTG